MMASTTAMSIEIFKPAYGGTPKRRPRRSLRPAAARESSVFQKEKKLDEFAKTFEAASASGDTFELARRYARIAAGRVDKLISIDAPTEDIETWSLEHRTWALVDTLYTYRAAPMKQQFKLYPTSSNTLAEETFNRNNRGAAENLLVIAWLQSTVSPPVAKTDVRGVKWQYTRATLKRKRLTVSAFTSVDAGANIVKTLDPDAPLRESASIVPQDAEFEHALFKHLFELMQAGDYDSAHAACKACGYHTLAAAMKGMEEYRDPILDGMSLNAEDTVAHGTKRKALWRRMCLQLAKAPQLDRFERAIYGMLCGDLDSVLDVSETWEAQLLAYAKHLAATQLEDFLRANGRFNVSLPRLQAFPHSQLSGLGDVLRALAESQVPAVRAQAEHPLRFMQGGIINGVVGSILRDAHMRLQDWREGGDDEGAAADILIEERYLLRFLAHLSLYLRALGLVAPESEEDVVALLSYYIEDLTICNKAYLVPLYVSQLPPDAAIEAYSYLLADIPDAAGRAAQFSMASKFNIDILNTLRRTIQRAFDDNANAFPPASSYTMFASAFSTPGVPSQSAFLLTGSLMWYVDAQMWDDVLASANALYILFLLAGDITAAEHLHSQLAAEPKFYAALADTEARTLLDEDDDNDETMGGDEEAWERVAAARDRHEFAEFEAFIHVMTCVRAWDAVYKERSGDHATTAKRAWTVRARQVLDDVRAVLPPLIVQWLAGVGEDSNPEKVAAVHKLRALYVPHMLLEFHRVLVEGSAASTEYAKMAMDMVPVVAAEDGPYVVHDLLAESGRLDEYLRAIASAALVVCADKDNGMWRI
ncbi:nuclear pore protein 84/107 [Limtongia smithiae]|uniref:nuclear pore protein 84/107 n=1 Tax=Limtongia smithiae TaxID=1125753 RepID=UPI0034CEE314